MLSARQQHCLKGIGIQQWVKRSVNGPALETVDALEIIETAAKQIVQRADSDIPVVKTPSPVRLDSWDDITQSIHQCKACELQIIVPKRFPVSAASRQRS